MKVLFLNAPYLPKFSRPQRSPAVTKSGTLYFPVWLAYAAGLAEKNGHQVKLLDAVAKGWDKQEVRRYFLKEQFEAVFIDTSTPSIYSDIEMAKMLKSAKPEAFIILVGTHISALPEESLHLAENGVDFVAIGEYDYTALNLLNALQNGNDLHSINGIAYLDNGNFIKNKPAEFINDLDSLPFVSETYHKHLNIRDYFNPNALYPMVTIVSGRGCPNTCTFCLYPQTLLGRKLRLRSAENVLEEMKYIIKTFPQARSIFFEDDTLTVDGERVAKLCEGIIRAGIKISWSGNARVDMDTKVLPLMKKAGCRLLCVGYESGDQGILNNIKKRTTIDMMEMFTREAHRAGILLHGCFMAGCPGETRETLQKTLDLALKLPLDTAQFFPIMVYPGTEAYEWFEIRGFISTKNYAQWLTPNGLHNSIVNTDQLTGRDLVEFCDMARRKFYTRPGYILRQIKKAMTSPGEAIRLFKAFNTFWRYLLRGSFYE